MTRQEMADYLGLTIEAVCRSLTKFKLVGSSASSMLGPSSFSNPAGPASDCRV